MMPARIVSLLASGTELVCALGLGDRLVGRSHECDHPEWVKRLPPVSRPTFDVSGSSEDIDRRVRERLLSGQPLYAIDEELLTSLAPDILITQTHCEVCAVSPADIAHGATTRLLRREVVALSAGTLEGILQGFQEVASVLGRAEEGRTLIAELRARMAALREKTRKLPHPTIACLEWIDPIFAMGNWGPELVEIAGGRDVLGNAGRHSASIPWEAVVEADPDVLVVAACGFPIERSRTEMPHLTERPGFDDLRAVRAGRVYIADGNLYFNRSGPTVFDTSRLLAEMLHPDVFEPEHEGTAWIRFDVPPSSPK